MITLENGQELWSRFQKSDMSKYNVKAINDKIERQLFIEVVELLTECYRHMNEL